MDWRVQKWKQLNYCRDPDKKLLWLGLKRLEKNVLTDGETF